MSHHKRIVEMQYRCHECHGWKPLRQRGTSGMCFACESVLADEMLMDRYGHGVETIACTVCHSTYRVVMGETAELVRGLIEHYCPWCDLGWPHADQLSKDDVRKAMEVWHERA